MFQNSQASKLKKGKKKSSWPLPKPSAREALGRFLFGSRPKRWTSLLGWRNGCKMCGLTGQLIFDGNARTLQPSLLQAMTDTMKHRGPDGEGIWIAEDGKVGFGFRRLSIVDRSTSADQPMSSGSVHLVFNGEIYNHLDIRKELSHYPWKTDHSDTEALLHAYEEWGIDFVNKLRGMFAIAIWDARTKELWLIRDRIGIKPLYYSVHSDYIHFASEIKALLQNPEQKRAVHEEALYHYLSFSMTPARQTLFDCIQKLSPGTWLRERATGMFGTTQIRSLVIQKKKWLKKYSAS